MTTNRNSSTIYAVLLMFLAIASFTMMAIAGRYVSDELDTFEIMMYRRVIGMLIISTFAVFTNRVKSIKSEHFSLHISRNLFHFAGQNLWFYAITVIPLVQVFALEFTVPIWVLLLSPIFLSESFTKPRVIAAVLGFGGILIITRPAPDSLNFGLVAAALSAIGFAGSIMFTKTLTGRTNTLSILFFMTVIQLGFGILCAGYDGDIEMVSWSALPWVVAIGLAGLLAHLSLTTALTLAPATVVTPIDFLRLPVIAYVGFALFGETIDIYVALGVILIFVGNYTNILAQHRQTSAS